MSKNGLDIYQYLPADTPPSFVKSIVQQANSSSHPNLAHRLRRHPAIYKKPKIYTYDQLLTATPRQAALHIHDIDYNLQLKLIANVTNLETLYALLEPDTYLISHATKNPLILDLTLLILRRLGTSKSLAFDYPSEIHPLKPYINKILKENLLTHEEITQITKAAARANSYYSVPELPDAFTKTRVPSILSRLKNTKGPLSTMLQRELQNLDFAAIPANRRFLKGFQPEIKRLLLLNNSTVIGQLLTHFHYDFFKNIFWDLPTSVQISIISPNYYLPNLRLDPEATDANAQQVLDIFTGIATTKNINFPVDFYHNLSEDLRTKVVPLIRVEHASYHVHDPLPISNYLASRLGNNPDNWQLASSLYANFPGTFKDLLDLADSISS